MKVKFIHTADWQLGKPFAGIEDDSKRSIVQQERICAIERIAQKATSEKAQFVLVAGDLFDSTSPTKATVSAACSAIGQMRVPVLVIPGNHDHAGPGTVWEQPFFRREQQQLAPNLMILLEAIPIELDSAIIFPCPLLRRHEGSDTTAWLRHLSDEGPLNAGKPRIILAHGSVQTFDGNLDGTDEARAANFIELERLPLDEFDYIALGDWHGFKKVHAKAWYSGTPETDRFPKGGGHSQGHILVVEAARGEIPEVAPLVTSRLQWRQLALEINGDETLAAVEAEVLAATEGRVQQDLLSLQLTGSMGVEADQRLEKQIEVWRARFLRLDLLKQTRITPTADEIQALTQRQDSLIPRVAARLLEAAKMPGEEGETALAALRELHSLCTPAI